MTYSELKSRHYAEVNAFPMAFAFDNEQFVTAMAKLGLQPDETDKIYSFGDSGGIYLRSDAATPHEMLDRHRDELADAMKNYAFALAAFGYELYNHEYSVTYDVQDTLDTLGLDAETVSASKTLSKALRTACRQHKSVLDKLKD